MEPLSYGEIVADRIREARYTAEQERRAVRRNVHSTPVIATWRIFLGRRLVSLGDRVAGCAELARGEAEPGIRLVA